MVFRKCGNTGLYTSAVTLGFWHNFGQDRDFETCFKIVTAAFNQGITHFDLANNYGNPGGSAEETFGRCLKNGLAAYRDEMIITTKAGYYMWPGPYGNGGSRKYLTASLDQSLKRMGLDYVDIFYSHRFDGDTNIEETMLALDNAVKQGKALYVGISNYNDRQTKDACKILKELKTPFVLNQVRYSMFDRHAEDGILDAAEDGGISLIAFSPLAQGLLTNKYLKGVPADSRAASSSQFLKESDITPEKIEKAKALNRIAADRGQSLSQMAIAWVLKDERVASALIGVSRPEQVEENIAALKNLTFKDDELSEITAILR